MPIRVLLADDHALVRQGIRVLLQEAVGIEVVGEAEDGRQAIDLAHDLRPDVVVMDINMPAVDGIEAMRRIRRETAAVNCIILSMHDSLELVHQALNSGARSYILKASVYDELEAAVRAAAHDQLYRSDVVQRYLRQAQLNEQAIPTNPLDHLSDREREVLELLAQGYRSNEIADELILSKKTVDKYRAAIMNKLDVRTPIELGRVYARYSRTANDR